MNGSLRSEALGDCLGEVRAKMSSLDQRIEELVQEMNALKGAAKNESAGARALSGEIQQVVRAGQHEDG